MDRVGAPVIDLRDVERERGGGAERFRLRIDRLRVADGERVALLGPSGCGKSTCLDLLAMTLRPSTVGCFRLRLPGESEVDVAGLWDAGARARLTALRARHFGYVLQTGGLLPFLSIAENALVSRRLLGLACPGPVPEILDFLGIGHLARRLPAKVSIGERQRAAVARAVSHRPRIVLADEPTASLDPHNAERVMGLFVRLAGELGITLILVSHDWEMVERHGLRPIPCQVEDDATVIRDGHR